MEIARKVQVDVFHWNDLCVSAATGTTFYTKTRSKTRLTKSNNSFLSDFIKSVCKSN